MLGALTHLTFVQSLLELPACAACLTGREVLHMGSGVTDRIKVVQWAEARLCAGCKQLRSRQVAGGREGSRVGLAFRLSDPELSPS